MNPSVSDIDFLKDLYAAARNKYKPSQVDLLLVAEAPPDSLDRHFYFEDVKKHDSLFLEIMGILYPERKARYLASGRDAVLKQELLEHFKADGFWLLDVSEVPLSVSDKPLERCVPSLLQRLKNYITTQTPIILVKSNIHDLCYPVLQCQGYKVSSQRLPFPGSGQQRIFREKFRRAISSY